MRLDEGAMCERVFPGRLLADDRDVLERGKDVAISEVNDAVECAHIHLNHEVLKRAKEGRILEGLDLLAHARTCGAEHEGAHVLEVRVAQNKRALVTGVRDVFQVDGVDECMPWGVALLSHRVNPARRSQTKELIDHVTGVLPRHRRHVAEPLAAELLIKCASYKVT